MTEREPSIGQNSLIYSSGSVEPTAHGGSSLVLLLGNISGFAVSEGRSGTVHSYITEPRHRLLVNNKFRKSGGKRVPGRACELAGDDVDRQLSYVPSPRDI